MLNSSIPTCYFPSTVAVIDDSRDFLLNFALQLDDQLTYRLFDSPKDALIFVRKKILSYNKYLEALDKDSSKTGIRSPISKQANSVFA